MKQFAGRVAVITGGAGTLGRAMAARFAREGMTIVLADLLAEPLEQAAAALRSTGATVLAVPTDVSKPESVDALAARTFDAYGAVHLIANNAGVAPLGAAWESTVADWQWALGVNLWGVVNGVRAFVPRMLAQGSEGHVVNVASVAGLISPPGMAVYNVTKHAVVAFTETLHHDLVSAGARVRCTVVCPAFFPSGIHESERARPAALENDAGPSAHQAELAKSLTKAVTSGRIGADEIAEMIFTAVRDERFYVLSHPRIKGAIQARMEDVLGEATPRDPMRPTT
jgi:NAD(P)-dependent dehydrogenase (short-subunit alcohol dehydrogenase family)